MQPPNDGQRNVLSYTACVVHHETNELLVKQDPVPVGKLERPLLLLRRKNNTPSLWAALIQTWSIRGDNFSHVLNVTHNITGGIDQRNWLLEQMCLSGIEETTSGHHEDQVGAVQDNDDDHPFSQLALQVLRYATVRLMYSTSLRHVPIMAVSSA